MHAILKRHGRVGPSQSTGCSAYQRFEKDAPNLLWQMDFKGRTPLATGRYCHPLTMLDDHSRYALCLRACANEQHDTVQEALAATLRHYGMPDAIIFDNGAPWGSGSYQGWTRLGVWLLKLGIDVLHSRPYHPQTRGKNERFHRTLKAEVFALQRLRSLPLAQQVFDVWRTVYNFERPHEALGQDVPANRYRPSSRSMPERLPEPQYDIHDIVRRVGTTKAYVSFKGQLWRVPQAFVGENVAIRPRGGDGHYGVFFGAKRIATIDLTNTESVSHVSEQESTMSPG